MVTFARVWNIKVSRTNTRLYNSHYVIFLYAVDIELSVSDITDSSVQISVNCTELIPSKFKDFAIKVTDDKSTSSLNVSYPCLTDLHFTNLTPNTTFNITLEWLDLTQSAECTIEEFTTLYGKGVAYS